MEKDISKTKLIYDFRRGSQLRSSMTENLKGLSNFVLIV